MSHHLLSGKKGIIFGALDEMSIAWKVAKKASEEGAVFTLTNTPIALRFGNLQELAEKVGAEIIPADATMVDDLHTVIIRSMELLGGKVDFILHSIAMSFHKMLQAAKKLDAINQWGSVLALSYIAAQRTLSRYNDLADAKAMLESIARSFGYIYGREKQIRINTISQSPTKTTAGSGVKGIDALLDFTERMSPLGNATAEECANFCIVLFSDLSRKITMQNLYHDGGFSSMGMSLKAMNQYNKCLDDED